MSAVPGIPLRIVLFNSQSVGSAEKRTEIVNFINDQEDYGRLAPWTFRPRTFRPTLMDISPHFNGRFAPPGTWTFRPMDVSAHGHFAPSPWKYRILIEIHQHLSHFNLEAYR